MLILFGLKQFVNCRFPGLLTLSTIFLLLFILTSSIASSATYYADATNGNDVNTGISESTPWKTIAKVNASKFNPGVRR